MASAGFLAIIASMVVSAFLTAWAGGSLTHSWIGWLSLLPLFLAIRLMRPLRALACGGLWGASLSLSCAAMNHTAVPATVSSFLLITGIPALYTLAGSALSRWIGFSPFVLGVSWMGVELALAPLGMHNGLLAGTQGDTALLDYVGRAFGYVLVAFLVAYVNAALVAVLGRVYLTITRFVPVTPSANYRSTLIPQVFGCLSPFAIQSSHPRAPPL